MANDSKLAFQSVELQVILVLFHQRVNLYQLLRSNALIGLSHLLLNDLV